MTRIYFIMLILISANVVAQKNVKESVTLEKPVVIDGDVNDWPMEWWVDPDGKFFCNVSNDADNLYVRLKVADDLTQQKIGLFGLSLKLNPSGKRKGKVGLKYPTGRDASEFKKKEPTEAEVARDTRDKVEMKRELLGDVDVVELIGLAKENIVSARLGLANGIEAMIITLPDGSYTYEAKIPFKAFRIKKSEVPILGVEFQTGRYTPQAKNNPNTNQNSPASGAGMGPNSYGMAGYRMPRYYGAGFSSAQYNTFSTPGYFFVAVKLK
ncbi:MAG TPA: hypothetical protein VL728_14800 [Cyclobacteriaceae bacterium]|nr:hypothetical protein [Cyclobacteriaceae bacterium]